MHLKLTFNVLLLGALLMSGCSGSRVVYTGTLNPNEYCEVIVDKIEIAKTFDAIIWDMNKPLWCATLSVKDTLISEGKKKNFVVCYQTPPPMGQFVIGQTLKIRRYDCERLLAVKHESILEWGDGWIGTDSGHR